MSRSPRPSSAPPARDDLLLVALRACADPVRLTILRLLARDAFGVQELGAVLDLGQATVSHHLKQLVEADLVTARRDGTHVFYRRALPRPQRPGAATLAALLAELDAQALGPGQRAALDAVFEERARRSRAFFARHADRLDAARELIATPADYLKELGDLLPTGGERALEIGPGPGEFLPVLAARFREVVALDSAAGMIERARETCRQAGLDNVRFETGEPPAPGQPLRPAALARPFDAIVCAMVLHHVPRPEDLLARAAALLSDAGALLVADLCPHEQDWVGEACGDVWRGIDADRLDHWAADAGLAAGPAQFLALRNGFRIQLKCFRRRHAPPAATDLYTPGSKETPA